VSVDVTGRQDKSLKQTVELLFTGALSITCQYSIHISSIARKVVEKGSADCTREQKALL
jgi:hypothetical protein